MIYRDGLWLVLARVIAAAMLACRNSPKNLGRPQVVRIDIWKRRRGILVCALRGPMR